MLQISHEMLAISDITDIDHSFSKYREERYIVLGVRRDVYNEHKGIVFPSEPQTIETVSVGEAINDLEKYDVGFSPDYPGLRHQDNETGISEYAMRAYFHHKKLRVLVKYLML